MLFRSALHLSTADLLSREMDGLSADQPQPNRVVLFSVDSEMNRCAVAMGFPAPLAGA